MGLVASTIPNLVNGVSQQPFALRLSSQSEEQINAFPSVVEGLKKRPPSLHTGRISTSQLGADQVFIHTINRDVNERYIVVVTNGDLKVYDLLGNPKTVAFPHGKGYLTNATPSTGFTGVTVADYTFIVNKSKVVTQSAVTSPVRTPEGMVYVSQGNYGKEYILYVDGIFIVGFKTPDGSVAAHANEIDTAIIARRLCYREATAGTYRGNPLAEQGSWLNFDLHGSVITITKKDLSNISIQTADGYGNRAMKAFAGSVQKFTDLPASDVTPGFHLEIVGDNSSNFDNYYVAYDTQRTNAGVWRETLKQGVSVGFDASNMPHILRREANGTFTFTPAAWDNRKVGDDDSSPMPSFVGRTITDVFFYRNRLGFISDENVVMSRASEFFNFWPTTVTTVLDTDPIDVSVAHTKVSILRHAVPFSEKLLLFSDQTQFSVDSGETLTPSTIAINQATEFEASLRAKPVGAGKNIYFAVDRGKWTGIREYFVNADSKTNDANDVTSHVPKYIPGGVVKLSASSNEDILVALSKNDRRSLYVYKYYYSTDEKLQSAWGRWEFDEDVTILNVDFIESTLFMVVNRSTGVYIERLRIELGYQQEEASFQVLLDRQFLVIPTPARVFNDATHGKGTVFQFPFDLSVTAPPAGTLLPVVAVVTKDQRVPEGVVLPLYSDGTSKTSGYAWGDYSDVRVIVGMPYQLRYVFSPVTIKEQTSGGGLATVGMGRLQLKKMILSYSNTGYFEVNVTPTGRDVSTYKYTGLTLGDQSAKIGEVDLDTGKFHFGVQAQNSEVLIELISRSHLPVAIMSAEWEGLYHARSQRLST